jgi:catechol 2,3-dioxygenase-like lactoylglutathione lyase family enzyme
LVWTGLSIGTFGVGASESGNRVPTVIFGAHVVLYSKDAAADRAFFRDVLGYASVDAGHEWLIFTLPPAELAVHPTDEDGGHELYLMCDDLQAEIGALLEKGVSCSEVEEARWGSVTKIQLPGGGQVGLYQPKHPTAIPNAHPQP